MSDLVQQFACTVPAGTAVATPQTFQCQLGIAILNRIRWRMPPGPNGQVGFYIASSLQQVIPFRSGNVPNWIKANNEWDVIELDDMPTSGDWQVVAYNLGANAHTIYVSFYTDSSPATPADIVPAALDVASISSPAPGA